MNNQTTSGDTAALLYSLLGKGREGEREGGREGGREGEGGRKGGREGEGGRESAHVSQGKSLQVLYLIFASSCHTLLHLRNKEEYE